MNLNSEQLSALTLLASGVALEEVEKLRPGLLIGDAKLIQQFIVSGVMPTSPQEQSAFDVARQLKQWYEQQLPAMTRQRSLTSQSDIDVAFSE